MSRGRFRIFWELLVLLMAWSICVALVDVVSEVTSAIYEAW